MRYTVFALVLLSGPVWAHDHEGVSYDKWTQPDNGASCCNNKDCRPSRAYMHEDGLWRAWNGSEWVAVPPGKVIEKPSPDGRTHWCGVGSTTYCLLVGDTKS